jgi:hypothetical protein
MPGPGNRPEAPKVYSQVQGPGMRPVYSGVSRDGKPTGFLGYEQDPSQGVVDVPKPDAILAEQARLGGKEIEPIYAEETIGRGNRKVSYGPPIGYRYDNGNSEYVNFTPSGEYQGTVKRQSGIDPAMLAILAAPFLGPLVFDALGLTGAAAGAGAAATPLAFTPEMIAAGAFTPGSIGAAGAAQGLLTAEQLAAAYGTGSSLLMPPPVNTQIPSGPPSTPGTPPPPNLELPTPFESSVPIESPIPNGPPSTPGTPPPPNVGPPGSNIPFELPSWVTPTNALLAASTLSGIANANKDEPTAPTFTMPAYVPPSGKPFANLGMSPIATPYTPTRIAGQYDQTMTPGGVSPYEMLLQQMQAPKNLYADFEAGTAMGGFNPQKFVIPPAAAATAPPKYKGGMIDKSSMVGPNPMGPDNGFTSIQDGEFVMNRKATQKYGIELMNAINSGKISKGKLSGLLQA